jgi:hypothetical protein
VKAEVFQQQNVAVFQLRRHLLDLRPDAVVDEAHRRHRVGVRLLGIRVDVQVGGIAAVGGAGDGVTLVDQLRE